MQQPVTNLVFPAINDRHKGKDDVVQGSRNDSGDNVAPGNPRDKYGRQSLKAEERGETEENANSDSASYGIGRIANSEQLD